MFFCSWLKEISLVKWDVTPIILAFKILILSNSRYVHSCGKPFPLKFNECTRDSRPATRPKPAGMIHCATVDSWSPADSRFFESLRETKIGLKNRIQIEKWGGEW